MVIIRSIQDYDTENTHIESFATGLFDIYGIGNLPKNDGVLLLIARGDRKARIELGKFYGHERDSDATSIMNDIIVPRFKEGDYGTGITNGVKAIMLEFADVRVGYNWMLIGILVSIPVLVVVCFNLFKAGKKGWAWAVVGVLIALVVFVFKILWAILEALPEGDSDSWESGGSGGGFGGGSSGGGGATGSW